ncbi:MAG: thioredoxin domain-containing protein [Sphingomonas fennica]
MMKALLALLLMLFGLAAAPAAPQRDWTKAVATLPSGAIVIGNPQAKVKLVEYTSMTCPHCAHFAKEGLPALMAGYVAPGKASIELRHAVRDPYDLAASLLVRCAGPAAYLPAMEAVFAAQDAWMGRAMKMTPAEIEAVQKQSRADQLVTVSRTIGLLSLMQARGLAEPKAVACLKSEPEQQKLAAMANEAWSERKIPGTPAFLLNGTIVADAADWAALKPRLDAALR